MFANMVRLYEDNHKICTQIGLSNDLAGLRVIEISTLAVVEAPVRCKYVALSYVWGNPTTDPSPCEDLSRPRRQ